MSLGVQRTLGDASDRVYTAYERLSTGQRINKASDDAAGLAIADALRVSSRLQTAAIRNVNDGISAINIISGTLGEQTGIVTRLLELAEQSANGTFAVMQRRSLSEEYLALVKEFGRLAHSTTFNGLNLLLGGRGSNTSSFGLQAGITGEALSQIGVTLSDTGQISGSIDWDLALPSGGGLSGTYTHDALAQATNGQVLRGNLTDSLGVSHEVIIAARQGILGPVGTPLLLQMLVRSSETISGASASSDSWTVLASFSPASVTFDEETGEYLLLNGGLNFTGLSNGATISGVNLDLSGLRLVSSSGGGAAPRGVATSIDWSGVESQTQARQSLATLRNRLDELNSIKGAFGAIQSRLNIARDLSAISRESTQAAESRIRDIDVAEESASLIAAQIRQQTASSVLKLANLQPKLLISLISDARK